MFWRTLGRLILLPIAFLISVVAAGVILVTLAQEHITHAMHGQSEDGFEFASMLIDLLWQGSFLLSGLSILPALVVILIGEVARVRSWLYYMVGGGLALACVPLLARADRLEQVNASTRHCMAGFCHGWVCRRLDLLADRRTQGLKPLFQTKPSPS